VYQEEFRENFESSEKKHDKKRSEPKSWFEAFPIAVLSICSCMASPSNF
jgi:hypothetical protein